jgi:uncharacterized membrane protein YeaQ/YmgE (transglycosylase-associated protein family)
MTLIGFLILVAVAAICGAVAQALIGFSRGGFLVSLFLGFVGAYLGTWLADELGLPLLLTIQVEGEEFPIIWSIIGAAILAFLFSALTRRRPAKR